MSTKSDMGTTGTGRRRNRSWPETLKREIVAASFAPGSSVSVVARQYDVNANQVFNWRKRYREDSRAAAVPCRLLCFIPRDGYGGPGCCRRATIDRHGDDRDRSVAFNSSSSTTGAVGLNPPERRDLLELLDDRHGRASTIVTSEIPVEHWHDIIGDPPSATRSWTASFIMLIAFNSPEKACERRTPAIKLLTPPQTPEPITMSVEAAAHDRAKYLLTIK